MLFEEGNKKRRAGRGSIVFLDTWISTVMMAGTSRNGASLIQFLNGGFSRARMSQVGCAAGKLCSFLRRSDES